MIAGYGHGLRNTFPKRDCKPVVAKLSTISEM